MALVLGGDIRYDTTDQFKDWSRGWNRITTVPPTNVQALPEVWVSIKEAGQLSNGRLINLGAATP